MPTATLWTSDADRWGHLGMVPNGADRSTIQGTLRGHDGPRACRCDGYIFFGSVKPPSFRVFSSTGMAVAEELLHVLSAAATLVGGSMS